MNYNNDQEKWNRKKESNQTAHEYRLTKYDISPPHENDVLEYVVHPKLEFAKLLIHNIKDQKVWEEEVKFRKGVELMPPKITDNSQQAHRTLLWLVTGKHRNNVANFIASRLIWIDIAAELNNERYVVANFSELLNYTVDRVSELNKVWLLYIKGLSDIKFANNEDFIMDVLAYRINEYHGGRIRPTIITISDDCNKFKNRIRELSWNNSCRVIKTKDELF